MSQLFNTVIFTIKTNAIPLAFVAGVCFLIGILFAVFASGIDKEGRKKGFHSAGYSGFEKKMDKQLEQEYEDGMGISSYLKDGQEHFASQKFK